MDITQGLADHLLGYAGAFPALGSDARRLPDLAVTATTFVDGFANLTVGNTLAKTDVHKNYPLGLLM